jgi:breast cancer metastasis-suppressor 1-like protein
MCAKWGLQGTGAWHTFIQEQQMSTWRSQWCTAAFLPPRLFRERLSQLRLRLEEVGAERAPEYTEPLGGLQQSLKIRIQVAGLWLSCLPPRTHSHLSSSTLNPALPHPILVALLFWAPEPQPSRAPSLLLSGIYKGFCLDVIRNKYECELQGAKQHLEVSTWIGTWKGE